MPSVVQRKNLPHAKKTGEIRASWIDGDKPRDLNCAPRKNNTAEGDSDHFNGGGGPLFLRDDYNLEGGLNVNKNDLIAAVASSTGLSKADAGKSVDAVFDAITSTLQGGGEVRLVGFGTFSVANRAASEGRNPQTGEKIKIPASKQPKFKAGKGLKDAVN